MQEEAKAALQHAVDNMKMYYDRGRDDAPKSQISNLVWLNLQNYTTNHPTKKLDHKCAGPFKITDTISSAAMKLKLTPQQRGIHPVVSVSNICPYSPDDIPEHQPHCKPIPDIIKGQEEFEIKKILDSRFRYCQLWYLVKFIGFPNSENEWMPYTKLKHAPEVIQNFHCLHPSTPCCHPAVKLVLPPHHPVS